MVLKLMCNVYESDLHDMFCRSGCPVPFSLVSTQWLQDHLDGSMGQTKSNEIVLGVYPSGEHFQELSRAFLSMQEHFIPLLTFIDVPLRFVVFNVYSMMTMKMFPNWRLFYYSPTFQLVNNFLHNSVIFMEIKL